ncbi:MAG: hypothetical protein K0B16_19275, partial [Burkholderiaceae bacterium]|nr:hypothetical protein [Burkholderiaceae bacterium]
MSRDLTPAFAAALAEADLRPALFFEGQFASGWLRLWTGLGEIAWNGALWAGAGSLLAVSSIDERGEVVASGTTISLSGVPLDMVQLAIAEARQGLPGRIWLALLAPDGSIIADPVQAFSGRLDVPQITDDAATCTITLSYESRLIDLTT